MGVHHHRGSIPPPERIRHPSKGTVSHNFNSNSASPKDESMNPVSQWFYHLLTPKFQMIYPTSNDQNNSPWPLQAETSHPCTIDARNTSITYVYIPFLVRSKSYLGLNTPLLDIFSILKAVPGEPGAVAFRTHIGLGIVQSHKNDLPRELNVQEARLFDIRSST